MGEVNEFSGNTGNTYDFTFGEVIYIAVDLLIERSEDPFFI